MAKTKLTEKMKKLADRWLELDNLADAHYAAGYSPKASRNTAKNNAFRILQRTEVKEYIDKRLKELADERIADVAEVMEFLTSVLRGQQTEEVVVVLGSRDFAEAEKVNKEVGQRERIKAAELLGRRYGMFTDKVDMNADMNINIQVDYGPDDSE